MAGQTWTAREKSVLRRQLREKEYDISSVRIRGRTFVAVRQMAVRLGLIDKGPSRRIWSRRQRRLLKELHKQGYKPEEIHRYNLLGEPARTMWSIRKMWGRLKLADRQRARKMRRKKVWGPGEKGRFNEYLHLHSLTKTPEQIGKEWDVARSTVARRQTELGVKVAREDVLKMEYSQAKQRRAARRIRRNNLVRWKRWRGRRQEKLREIAQQYRARQNPPPERVCDDCGKSWPKRWEFFHPSDKRNELGTSRYYKHRCRLCENQRRRAKDQKRRKRVERRARCPAPNRDGPR